MNHRILTVTTETAPFVADDLTRRVLSGRQKVMRIEAQPGHGVVTIFEKRFLNLGYEVYQWSQDVLFFNSSDSIEQALETIRKKEVLAILFLIGQISDLNEKDFEKARRIETALETHGRLGGNILYIFRPRSG